MNIWQECNGTSHICPLNCRTTRIVESQQQVATMSLVDTHDEQELLEQLLEESKPILKDKEKHYLITTPFRYPPLRYGSRFGEKHYSGIFYGSQNIQTCFSECAYYRLLFIEGMEVVPEQIKIHTQHLTFSITVKTDNAIQLQHSPFTNYDCLTSPDDYHATQQLGAQMREHNIQAFTFQSARDHSNGTNIGIFDSSAIISKQPYQINHWQCTTSEKSVIFYDHINNSSFEFSRNQFLVNDLLPSPAI